LISFLWFILVNMLLEKNFAIVDVETTGGSPFFNRVIEIGLLRVEKGEVVKEYKQLLNPGIPIPEFITDMTGISEADVAEAPTFEDIADEVLELFEDAIFVAHNSQFDYGFLKEEFRRIGYGFNVDQLCTVRLSRALFKEHKHHNLTALIERYEFECQNRHRAFDDAKVLWDFLQHVHTNVEEKQLQKAFKQLLKQPRVAKAKTKSEDDLTYETDSGEILAIN
jgi:DNA polymerase III subunit epsilon